MMEVMMGDVVVCQDIFDFKVGVLQDEIDD